MAQSAGLALPSTNDIIKGTITRVISPTNFITSLVGYGDNFFQDWDVYIVKVTSGSGFAPQGDRVQCNLYTSKKGEISLIRAFDTSTPVVGDTIFMMHPFYGQNSLIVDVPSNDLKQSSDEKVSTAAIVLTQVAALAWTGKVGGCRVKFDMRITPAGTASAVIYKNGVPVVSNPGTTPNYTIHTNALNTFVTFSQDIFGLVVGDIIQIYAMTGGAGTTEIQNFRIYYDLNHLASVEATTEAVFYDEENGVSGTDWPIGTVRMPSNNYTDTMAIAAERNIHKITIIGGGTFTISTDFTMAIEGSSYCDVTINAGVTVNILGDLTCKTFTNLGALFMYGNLIVNECNFSADANSSVLGNISCNTDFTFNNLVLGTSLPILGNVIIGNDFITDGVGTISIFGDCECMHLKHECVFLYVYGNFTAKVSLNSDGVIAIWGNCYTDTISTSVRAPLSIHGDCYCYSDTGFYSLQTRQETKIYGNLYCKAEIYGVGKLIVSGNVFCEAIIDVGLLTVIFNGNLYCHGASTFNFNSILSVDGHTIIHALVNNGTGALIFNGGLECYGDLECYSNFSCLGDCLVSGSFYCDLATTIYGNFKANNISLAEFTINGDVESSNDFLTKANGTILGNVNTDNFVMTVGGLVVSIEGDLHASDIVTTAGAPGSLTIDGNIECGGDIDNGANCTLTVTGGIKCHGTILSIGVLISNGDCTVMGEQLFCADELTIYGDIKARQCNFAGINTNIYGSIICSESIILGDSATIYGSVESSVFVINLATATVVVWGDVIARSVVDTMAGSTLTIHGYLDNFGADAILGTATYKERPLHMMDFWSLPEDAITITSAAADIALPDVVVADLPVQCHVVRAVALFKFRAMENSNVAANKINGAQEIQVDDSAATGWLDAINLIDDEFALAASTREWGEIVIGSANVATRVDANDTYSFQWDEALVDVDSLIFNDIQVGLRIWYR